MKYVTCTPETIPRVIELVKTYTHVYGVDVIECGIQDLHVAFLNHSSSDPRIVVGELIDDDGEVLSTNSFFFAETMPACIARSGFHTKVGLQRYGALGLVKKIIEMGFYIIRERGATECYWVQRTGRARQIDTLFDDLTLPGKTMEGWVVRDLEYIEPFGRANNELLGTYLLGPFNGIIPKPMVIKQLYKKDAYRKN